MVDKGKTHLFVESRDTFRGGIEDDQVPLAQAVQRLFGPAALAPLLELVKGPLDRRGELSQVALVYAVRGAAFHGLDGQVFPYGAAYENERHARVAGTDFLECQESVIGRKAEVREDDVGVEFQEAFFKCSFVRDMKDV